MVSISRLFDGKDKGELNTVSARLSLKTMDKGKLNTDSARGPSDAKDKGNSTQFLYVVTPKPKTKAN